MLEVQHPRQTHQPVPEPSLHTSLVAMLEVQGPRLSHPGPEPNLHYSLTAMLEVQDPGLSHPGPISPSPNQVWPELYNLASNPCPLWIYLDFVIEMPPPVNSRDHWRCGYHQDISVSGGLTKPSIALWGTTKPQFATRIMGPPHHNYTTATFFLIYHTN